MDKRIVGNNVMYQERSEGGQFLATPFFSQDNGVTLIKGGTVGPLGGAG